MTTNDFITQLFCRVDDMMPEAQKHPQASLYPSEVITLAILFALKGVGNRAFYRWLERDYKPMFPKLPDRTRLFRLFNTHRQWTQLFMADHSLIGVVDSYGIELIHPRREGRSDQQIGRKGLSNKRWIVGCKLCYVINHLGLIVDWDADTANVYDGSAFQDLANRNVDYMALFADEGLAKKDWHPQSCPILQLLPRSVINFFDPSALADFARDIEQLEVCADPANPFVLFGIDQHSYGFPTPGDDHGTFLYSFKQRGKMVVCIGNRNVHSGFLRLSIYHSGVNIRNLKYVIAVFQQPVCQRSTCIDVRQKFHLSRHPFKNQFTCHQLLGIKQCCLDVFQLKFWIIF